MKEPDYVVLRPPAELPPGFNFPDRWNGRWLDRSEVPDGPGPIPPPGLVSSTVSFVSTGRFEVREYDGAVAEVWEMLPPGQPTA